jgi:WD40 repeat protein
MMATMRRSHGEAISSVAVSPDGRTIATGGGRLAKLWDAASGREIGSLQRRDPKWPLYSVKTVAFSPDGTLLAVADAWAVTLWEAATRRELDPLPGPPAHSSLVAFSPDGAFLVSTGAPLRTWNLRSKIEPASMSAGIDGSGAIAFSPDGKMVAVGATANTIGVWELATPKQLQELKGHSDYVTALAFSADGKTLASGSADESIKLWDTSSWQEIVTLKESSRVTSVAFSPRTNLLASSTFQGVRLWYTDSAADVQRAMARPRPPR